MISSGNDLVKVVLANVLNVVATTVVASSTVVSANGGAVAREYSNVSGMTKHEPHVNAHKLKISASPHRFRYIEQ